MNDREKALDWLNDITISSPGDRHYYENIRQALQQPPVDPVCKKSLPTEQVDLDALKKEVTKDWNNKD